MSGIDRKKSLSVSPGSDALAGGTPLLRGSHRVLLAAAALQVVAIVLLALTGDSSRPEPWSWLVERMAEAQEIGGAATLPLGLCLLALLCSAIALTLQRVSLIQLPPGGERWAAHGLRYSGRVAWMLGLLQTLLSLYAVRFIFAAELPYQETVSRLGDISGAAYGSSLIGGGALLIGWIVQLLLTGRMED